VKVKTGFQGRDPHIEPAKPGREWESDRTRAASGLVVGSVERKTKLSRRRWVANLMTVLKVAFDVDFDFVLCVGWGSSLVARCGAWRF
jgi:hypothetical protein